MDKILKESHRWNAEVSRCSLLLGNGCVIADQPFSIEADQYCAVSREQMSVTSRHMVLLLLSDAGAIVDQPNSGQPTWYKIPKEFHC